MDHHDIKLESNLNTNYRKPTDSWKLNDVQLNHHWVKEEIKTEIENFIEHNENECTTYSNLWDIMKALLRRTFKALKTYKES